MKIKIIAIAFAFNLVVAFSVFALFSNAATSAAAAAAEPGSTADPIALKSYVDSKIAELETRMTAMMQDSSQTTQQNSAQNITQGAPQSSPGTATIAAEQGVNQNYTDTFIPVETYANQRIMLGEGTEMVLRTGNASAIHGELGALVDLISGRDLEAGESVPINHLILSPRNDNRGVRISEDAWVLIKGAYEIR